MDHADHVALIRPALGGRTQAPAGAWADLGSGEGAFTLALADLLGTAGGTILSVDLDAGALRVQERAMARRFPAAAVGYRRADFTQPGALGTDPASLDGVLMANSLHYVADQAVLLGHLVALLKPGGRFVLVEYDTDAGNRWVPYPVPFPAWERLAARAGLRGTRRVHSVPSRFLGRIYSAASDAPER